MDYDVIIAGGSFAGLAAAAQLRGKRVLLIEPHSIGSIQTSACGTPLAVLEATGTGDSLIQVHDRILLHLDRRTIEFPLDYPFCTFDFLTFASRMLESSDAEIMRAAVLGHRGHMVLTTRGTFDAGILIDASGWRAALATGQLTKTDRAQGLSFGLESVVPVAEQGLHFYYHPKQLGMANVGWVFPIDGASRAGVASYHGRTQLNRLLSEFLLTSVGQPVGSRHGGYIPLRSKPATTGHVFRVGDAAGQCFPLTAEGIRPALYFGAAVGRLARRVLAGELSEAEALREYQAFVNRHQPLYRLLRAMQVGLPRLPLSWIAALARQIRRPVGFSAILNVYWRAADPRSLTVNSDPSSLSADPAAAHIDRAHLPEDMARRSQSR